MVAVALDNDIDNSALFFKVFQLLLTISFPPKELLNRISPITQDTSQTLFQGYLVGKFSKAGLRTMQHIPSLSNYKLIKHNSVELVSSMLGGIINGFVGLALFLCGTLGIS